MAVLCHGSHIDTAGRVVIPEALRNYAVVGVDFTILRVVRLRSPWSHDAGV